MTINLKATGHVERPLRRAWQSNDAILYALGVGAAGGGPLTELEFTTENSESVRQKVLPTFAVLLAPAEPPRQIGEYDHTQLLHGEQSVTLHHPLPVHGQSDGTLTVTGIYDKGSSALVTMSSEIVDATTGQLLASTQSSAFIRGEGGFGGDRGPADSWELPARPADVCVEYSTHPEQALLYRLSGDHNPLHSDPSIAQRAGFPSPILHGLCTFGFAGRALLHTLCESDPARFLSMSARFTQPVVPGDRLTVSMWVDGDSAVFRVTVDPERIVLDRGRFTFKDSLRGGRHREQKGQVSKRA